MKTKHIKQFQYISLLRAVIVFFIFYRASKLIWSNIRRCKLTYNISKSKPDVYTINLWDKQYCTWIVGIDNIISSFSADFFRNVNLHFL